MQKPQSRPRRSPKQRPSKSAATETSKEQRMQYNAVPERTISQILLDVRCILDAGGDKNAIQNHANRIGVLCETVFGWVRNFHKTASLVLGNEERKELCEKHTHATWLTDVVQEDDASFDPRLIERTVENIQAWRSSMNDRAIRERLDEENIPLQLANLWYDRYAKFIV